MIVNADGYPGISSAIQVTEWEAEVIADGMDRAFAAGQRRRSEEITALLKG
ncbi:hypothetical protein [Azospirillum sp. TSA6c]|uniref:hypothetical protein n=1 Tax=Azospirillum sp. TSA6c TaxID=709813 RepID=UPI001304ACE0|nr:hypothetical protein [Azospirillum sp. TSA6c]